MKTDLEILENLATQISDEKETSKKLEFWKDSKFSFFLTCPSRQKGALAEELLSRFLREKNIKVEKAKKSSYDRIVEGKKCEIKFSMLWENGSYTFQQIRSTEWDYILCFGISPRQSHLWFAKRDIIGYLPGQHSGRGGTDTRWIKNLYPNRENPYPNYLKGGDFSYGCELFIEEIKLQ